MENSPRVPGGGGGGVAGGVAGGAAGGVGGVGMGGSTARGAGSLYKTISNPEKHNTYNI